MTIFDAALTWLARGVALVPLQPRSKRIIEGFGPYLCKVQDREQAAFWFRDRPCNLGLVTGGGLVVYDFDRAEQWERWRARCPDLAQTYTEKTMNGAHVFFLGDGMTTKMLCGIESKGKGGVVTVAPSVHPSGFVYSSLDVHAPILRFPGGLSLLSGSPRPLSRENAMAYGDDVIGKIKQAHDVLDLAQSVTSLKSINGRWWHGPCPFETHKKTMKHGALPFWVDSERGLWGCYACGVRGDVINLWAKVKRMSIQEAIRDMATVL
jgi:hypothetical protein